MKIIHTFRFWSFRSWLKFAWSPAFKLRCMYISDPHATKSEYLGKLSFMGNIEYVSMATICGNQYATKHWKSNLYKIFISFAYDIKKMDRSRGYENWWNLYAYLFNCIQSLMHKRMKKLQHVKSVHVHVLYLPYPRCISLLEANNAKKSENCSLGSLVHWQQWKAKLSTPP